MKETALITGGAQRIGREISIFLASLSYDIALCYNTSEKDAQDTAKAIRALDRKCELFKSDLSEEDNLYSLIPAVMKKFHDLHVLVNNASIFKRATIEKTDVELFDKHIGINLKAPFFLSKEFAKAVKRGSIINILDTRISSDRTTYAAYSLSKKALAEVTRMSALEFAPDIRVNAIAPGLILPPEGKSDEYLDRLAEKVPLKRKGNTKNVTEAIRFLLSNDYITGQIIFCDGGEHLKP